MFAPPPRLTISEWADRYRVLSSEAAAEPGPWSSDRAPYQRGIMDALADPLVERVVLMCASQIGKTEILNNAVGFYIDQEPSPILVVQPNVDPMAKAWSTDRLAPMLRDTPRLRGKVSEPRSRDAGNTILHKVFPGGHITVVGANSPAGLASRPIRVVLFDEVDRYGDSAGTEGDPVELGIQRAATFSWNRKILLVSTPLLKGLSRIEQEWEKSDQRRYWVPCPSCGTFQVLQWAQIRWTDEDPGTARLACLACGVLHDEPAKLGMLRAGEWRADRPGARAAGFHLSALYSPWKRWAELVAAWLPAQRDITRLQTFVNLQLGESWEERGGGVDPTGLLARREPYAAEVPGGVGILTAGVDVQDTRLEVVVRGWGAGEESWLCGRHIIVGDPASADVWTQLDAYLLRGWRHEDGATLRIDTACLDSGAHTEQVYRFCQPRYARRVFATKGASTPGHPLVARRPSVNNRYRVRLFLVGTDAAKDLLYGWLRITTPGPRYMHLPAVPWCDEDYVTQLTAEKVMRRQVHGKWTRRYELPRGARNEVLDCEVLALVALRLSRAPQGPAGSAPAPPGSRPPPGPERPPSLAQEKLRQTLATRTRPRRGWIRDY